MRQYPIIGVFIFILLSGIVSPFANAFASFLQWILLLAIIPVILWNKKWKNLYFGIPIVVGYLLSICSSSISHSIYQIFKPIPEATFEDNLIGIGLGLIAGVIAAFVYRLNILAISATIGLCILFLFSIVAENTRIYQQTGSSWAHFTLNIIPGLVSLFLIFYLFGVNFVLLRSLARNRE